MREINMGWSSSIVVLLMCLSGSTAVANDVEVSSGNFVIAGSDTMQPLMVQLASGFRQQHPDVRIGVLGGGSERALMQFISGQSQIRRGDGYYHGTQVSGHVSMLASSRPLTTEEAHSFHTRFGYDPTELIIANDALTIYTHRDNPLLELTLQELDAIFSRPPHSNNIQDVTFWDQVGLLSWKGRPIHLYGRDAQSATRTFFIQEVLHGEQFKETIHELPGSASELLAIGNDPLAIGYASIGFQTSFTRIIPIAQDDRHRSYLPNDVTIAEGIYPLSRPLYLYVNRDPDEKLHPEQFAFVNFLNSTDGQLIVKRTGFYTLSSSQIARNLHVLMGPFAIHHGGGQ